MKRRIIAIFISTLLLAGCGNAEYVRDLEESATTGESNGKTEESDSEVDITQETDTDNTAAAEEPDETADTEEVGEGDNSDGEESTEEAPDVDNPVLTAESADLFRDYLLRNLESDYFNGDECPLYECTFALCDVNHDGYMDLIVSGYVGVRVAADSLVVFNNNGELKTDTFYGIVELQNENHMLVNASNYGGAGEEFYTDCQIYSYNSDFTYTYDGRYELGELYYDSETDTEYNPPQQMYVRFTAGEDGWEISPEEYSAILEEYKLDDQHILMSYSLTVENVNMYVQ